jgi:regulator of replication initiation timing
VYQKIMASQDVEYVVRLTYAELYNEELKDLLASGPSADKLNIRDDPALGPVIDGITEVNFTTPTEVKQLLDEGENRRHFGVTNMNAHSSRSHVLVRLNIESRKVTSKPSHPLRPNWGKDKPSLISTLNLVDLAGSERASKSGTSGASLKEGAFINKSLLTLGTVISALSEGKKEGYINYRESKLTRLLSSALGGNAKTTMITCISPALGNIFESQSTLRFASRAKRIVNQVTRNEVVTTKSLQQKLDVANGELDKLRAQLDLSRQMGYVVDEGGLPGETVKDKAIALSRNMRNLLFVTANGNKLAAGLKKAGMLHLAKKVQSDLAAVQRGARKDLNVVIEEHSDLAVAYLKNDRKIHSRMQVLAEENESDRFFGEGDAAELYSVDGDGVANMDAEELHEQLEGASFYGEEVRAVAVQHITSLQRDLAAAALREREARDLIASLRGTIIDQEDTINRHVTNELNLQNTINKAQDELAEERLAGKHKEKKIGALEAQLLEHENGMSKRDHDIVARDAEIVRFRTAAEQFERDLATANAQKKLLEEEFSRQRNDMRGQMEKMRGNMHTMLQHGGDQVKVLEQQIENLQKELESVKDILEEECRSKERLELEMSHLRGNIAMLQDEQRVHISEMNISRKEVGRRFYSSETYICVNDSCAVVGYLSAPSWLRRSRTRVGSSSRSARPSPSRRSTTPR